MNHDIIWKDIKGYEGVYEISNNGIIRRVIDHAPKKQHLDNVGYYAVSLWKDGVGKLIRVHRLLAEAFIPNPLNLPCINHKDENRANNSLDNLEWCTKAYNNTYGGKIDRMRSKKKKSILQKDRKGNVVKEWDSIKSAAATLGINETQISRYARGVIRGLYNGFYWEYKIPQVYKERKGKRIGKFDLDGNLIATFDSIMEASKSATVTSFTISNCVNGHTQTAGGYYWKQLS